MAGKYTSMVDEQNTKDFSPGRTRDLADARRALDQQGEMAQAKLQQEREQPAIQARAKANEAQSIQEKNIAKLKELMAGTGPGKKMSYHLGAGGEVAASEAEESPYKRDAAAQAHHAKAMSHAYDMYNKAFPEVQKGYQAATEGLEAVNDPKQISSVGQAKTLMIKNLGMNRYNQQEGNALVPPQFAQVMHQVFNTMGSDDNPLTDNQRSALNATFLNKMNSVKSQHNMAKKNAMGSYASSGYYDPSQGAVLQSQMGPEFDKEVDNSLERFKNVPHNTGYQPSQSQQPQPQKSASNLWGFLNQQQPQAAPAFDRDAIAKELQRRGK